MRSNLAIDDDGLRAEIFQAFLDERPQNDDELHFWIKTFTGFDIPRRPSGICAGHSAPFDFIADQFFERVESAFGFGNRSSGKTRMTAILNLCDLVFKPGIEIVSAGAILPQAIRGYQYLLEFFKDPLLATLIPYRKPPTMGRTILTNGSQITIVTATAGGFNGPHPTKLRIDELELIWMAYIQEALSLTQGHPDGWKAQDTFTSTRKVAHGPVQKFLDEAEERNLKVYNFCIWENIERCTRQCRNDPEFGNCKAYSKKDKEGKDYGVCGIIERDQQGLVIPNQPIRGRAQQVSDGGWYKIGDFVKKAALLDKGTWEAQWLNNKPSGGSLVYGEFFSDEEPFVVSPATAAQLLERAKREDNWARVIGIDFGSHFAVEYFMQDPLEAPYGWYCYHEIYWDEEDLTLEKRSELIIKGDPLGWSNRAMVYADPSGKQQITDLDGFSIETIPANNDVMAGILRCKQLFERRGPNATPGLRLFPTAVRLRKELSETYVHPQEKDGTVNRDKVWKKEDHACDAMRYAMLTFSANESHYVGNRRVEGLW